MINDPIHDAELLVGLRNLATAALIKGEAYVWVPMHWANELNRIVGEAPYLHTDTHNRHGYQAVQLKDRVEHAFDILQNFAAPRLRGEIR